MDTATKLTDDVLDVLANGWSAPYETRDGEAIVGLRLDDLKKELRTKGWRNLTSSLDSDAVKKLGFRVVAARYTGGVRPKQFAREVVTLS